MISVVEGTFASECWAVKSQFFEVREQGNEGEDLW